MIIYPGLLLPAASSDPPESRPGRPIAFYSVLLQMGFTCAPTVTSRAVVSYTAFPSLPVSRRFISVALSLESPPPDVIRHFALRSPDFPHLQPFGICSRDHLSYLFLISFFVATLSATESYYNLYFSYHAIILSMKYTSAYKFTYNRIFRQIFTAHSQEIFQELQKPFGFKIFRLALFNTE